MAVFLFPRPVGRKSRKENEMSNEEEKNVNNQEEEQENVEETTAESEKTEKEHMIPKSRLDNEIQKRKDAEKRAAALEKANKEAEKKRLKAQEDYKGLYDTTLTELQEVKPKAERVTELESTIEEMLSSEIKSIPEDKRTLIPDELSADAKLRYISRNRALLSKAKPVDLGAGERGGGAKKSIELSQEQKETARKLNISEEEYAKNL